MYRRRFRVLRDLQKDESGSVLIWFTVVIVAVLGLIGLAIDGARYVNLNSNLQEVADAAALAGAKELDGAKDAITRARNAAINLLSNNPKWSDIAQSGVQIVSTGDFRPTFYSSVNPDVVTTDPKNASYIRVSTVQRGMNPSFIQVVSTAGAVFTNAGATAKSAFSVCKPLQSYMCNPWESEESNPGNAGSFAAHIPVGTMLKLVEGTGASSGNWGLLQPPGTNGNPNKNQPPFWAQTAPDDCPQVLVPDASSTNSPGNTAKFAVDGMNVRFDNPVAAGDQSLSAPVVIDGLKANNINSGFSCKNSTSATPNGTGSQKSLTFKQTNDCPTCYQQYDSYCNASPVVGSCPLPRDRTFTQAGGHSWSSVLIGTGPTTADLQAYWKNHHSGSLSADMTTRYQIYTAEANGTAAFTVASEGKEPHAPACKKSTVGDPDRRVIEVAIVDCDYWGVNGRKQLPIITLTARFFMTEPADTNGSIYAELIGTSQVNGPGTDIYQIVQLVR